MIIESLSKLLLLWLSIYKTGKVCERRGLALDGYAA